jgi:ubiquinone/menaquinone biosynthesis C-methylase UbiE
MTERDKREDNGNRGGRSRVTVPLMKDTFLQGFNRDKCRPPSGRSTAAQMMRVGDAERLLIREYGRTASIFDRFSVTSSNDVWGALRRFLPNLDGLRVLDLGCGPGAHTVRLARAVGDSGSVVGVDAARGMVEFARHRRGARGRKNLTFRLMDNRDLRLPDQSFDLVVSTFGLADVDRKQVVRETFRVLGNGGRFLCVSWGRANLESRAFADSLQALRREKPPPPDVLKLSQARRLIADLPENRPGRDRHPLMTLLRKAGFDAVRRRTDRVTHRFRTVGAYIRYKAAWGEYYRDLSRLTRTESRRFADDVARRVGWRSTRPGRPVTWELAFITARKRKRGASRAHRHILSANAAVRAARARGRSSLARPRA